MKLLKIKNKDWHAFIILCVAIFFRFFILALKPPHSDEGVIGWFADQISETGFFRYDPTNFHGPLPIYVIYFFQKVFGHNLWALRAPGALVGVGSVWLVLKFQRFFSRTAILVTAWFMALSPGMIFFSRGTIHEPFLLFFVILSVYGFFKKDTPLSVAGVVGMLTTKETWTISVLSFVVAGLLSKNFSIKKIEFEKLKKWFVKNQNTLLLALFILITLFSGLFKDPWGLAHFFKAYLPWLQTAQTGQGHEKPFYYWLSLMWRYESIALLGLIFSSKYIFSNHKEHKLLAYFACLQFLIYTLIPYKTPWCLLQISWPLFFLAGFSFENLTKSKKTNKLEVVILGTFLLLSTIQAIQLNFVKPTDETEPYVYVQTFNDFTQVTDKIRKQAERTPELKKEKLLVIMGNSWPLPWVLWDFKNAAYYSEPPPAAVISEMPHGAIIFVDKDKAPAFDLLLKTDFESQIYRQRPAMGEVVVYFSKKMFHNNTK